MEENMKPSTSRAQANRINGLRSTGPRTPTGKTAASLNALKHGLLSQQVVLPGEDHEALQDLRERFYGALEPSGDLEVFLADRVVAAAWRLRRAHGIERDMMDADLAAKASLEDLILYGEGDDRRSTLGAAFARAVAEDDTYGKFARYEAHIERGLYRALHELQRLQAARAGVLHSPPAVLDVDLAISEDVWHTDVASHEASAMGVERPTV